MQAIIFFRLDFALIVQMLDKLQFNITLRSHSYHKQQNFTSCINWLCSPETQEHNERVMQ